MAIDMPPAPPAAEYRVEQPRRIALGQLFEAAKLMTESFGTAAVPPGSTTARNPSGAGLPRLDPGSRAMTGEDRTALAKAIETNGSRQMARGVDAPGSYVGDRVRLATMRVRAMEASSQGRLTPEQAHEVRCRTAAVAMDRRAGAYVQGGERAAAASRAAIPPQVIEQCRATMARHAERTRAAAVGIDPSTARGPAHTPQGNDHAAVARQRVDPRPSVKVGIEPQGTRPVSVTPTASEKVRIDPRPSRPVQVAFSQSGRDR